MNRFTIRAAILQICTALTAFSAPVLNEIMFRPGTSFPENTQLEFVELFNSTDSVMDLSGWGFTKGITYTFPQGTSIGAQGYLVISANPGVVGVTKTEPLRELVWEPRKDPDHERQEIYD